MSGGYEENGSVASYIWDSLAQNKREDLLNEANLEQEPLPNLHNVWPTPGEQAKRENQSLNDEVTRRLNKHVFRDARPENTTTTIIDEDIAPTIVDASNSESEKEDRIEDLRQHIPRRSAKVRSNRRSTRLADKEPQYMGLFYSLKGEEDVLGITDVSNIVQRDEYFWHLWI